jgi:hypothetical protein
VIAVAFSSGLGGDAVAREFSNRIREGEICVADLIDIAIPANGQGAAEALGLKVHCSVTTGPRVRLIPRDEAEIAVECLRDWGVSARILENALRVEPAPERGSATVAQG